MFIRKSRHDAIVVAMQAEIDGRAHDVRMAEQAYETATALGRGREKVIKRLIAERDSLTVELAQYRAREQPRDPKTGRMMRKLRAKASA